MRLWLRWCAHALVGALSHKRRVSTCTRNIHTCVHTKCTPHMSTTDLTWHKGPKPHSETTTKRSYTRGVLCCRCISRGSSSHCSRYFRLPLANSSLQRPQDRLAVAVCALSLRVGLCSADGRGQNTARATVITYRCGTDTHTHRQDNVRTHTQTVSNVRTHTDRTRTKTDASVKNRPARSGRGKQHQTQYCTDDFVFQNAKVEQQTQAGRMCRR